MNELKTVALEILKNKKSILDMNEDDQMTAIVNAFEFAKTFLAYASSINQIEEELQ